MNPDQLESPRRVEENAQKIAQVLSVVVLFLVLAAGFILPLSLGQRFVLLFGVLGAAACALTLYAITPDHRRWLIFIDLLYIFFINLIIWSTGAWGLNFLWLYFLLLSAHAFFVRWDRLVVGLILVAASISADWLFIPSGLDLSLKLLFAAMMILGVAALSILIWNCVNELNLLASRRHRLRQIIDRLKEAEKDKTEILSLVTHQLKTPISLIRWSVESVLDNTSLTPKERERLEQSIATTHVMFNTIEDLSHIFKLIGKSGAEYLHLEPLSVKEVVKELLSEYTAILDQRQMKINVVEPAYDLTIKADKIFFKHALANLLDNAIKYSPDKSEIVIILSRSRGEVRIAVKDHGIGIEPVNQGRIFERFFRTDAARKVNEHGTGLGLYLVKVICEQMHGRVELVSTVGQGSTFTLVFATITTA